MINITTPTHHPSNVGSLASLDATFSAQTPHAHHNGSPSEPSTQDDSHATPEKNLNQLKFIKKRKPQIIFNVSDTKYDVVKHVGEKIFDWRLSYDRNAEWDIFWTDGAVEPETLSKMHPYQKINHFPGMYCLARKNHLGKHLMRMRKAFPAEYKFFPETYLLPAEYTEFSIQCTTKMSTYIVKPEASCQGKGIFLTRTGENIQPGERYVVQKYLANPYLIDGLKFDLRVYVLLAGCDPLRIYVYEDGLVRLATEPYVVPSGKNMDNMCMHLTNYAVNKANPNFVFNASEENDDVGHKRSLKSLMKMLEEKGHDTKTLWKEIKKLITKTFCGVQPLLAQNYRTCQADEPYNNMCFEILGQLKPYLLEVNHTPSFTTDTPLDRNIKKNVIHDALKLMNISLETKHAYKKKKRIELRKRILTGKATKTSTEERKAEIERAQRERDEWESNNLGGYQKVFPLEDPSQADEDYDKLLKEATKWYDTFTGLAVKRNDKKTPTGSEAGKMPPMVFGMGSPTNKPGAASNRDGQNVAMQKLRRPVHTARNGSVQIPSINNSTKLEVPGDNLGTYPSKNDLSMAGTGSLNVDKKEEEEKTGTKSVPYGYHGRTSIKMDDFDMGDKRVQGEDEDDPPEHSNKFSQRSRFATIKIFENSLDDKVERSSQDSREISQDRSGKHQHHEPEKSQFFKIKSNHLNSLPKDYVYMNKNREAMKPKSPNANTAPYLPRTYTNESAMGRYEEYLNQKLYTTDTIIHEKTTEDSFQVGSLNHLHLQRRETIGRGQTQSRSIRTQHGSTRSIQKDYLSVPRTFELNIHTREPIVEYQRDAISFGQKQILNRTYIKRDNPTNKRVVMTNNMFGDDRLNNNQLLSNNVRRKY